MKRKILLILTWFIGAITQAQTIQPANLNNTGNSVEITFAPKGDVIQATFSTSLGRENSLEFLSVKFLGNARSQIILEDILISSIVNKATGLSTTLNPAGKDKFAIPNDLPAGNYNFLLNGKLIATNYKVR